MPVRPARRSRSSYMTREPAPFVESICCAARPASSGPLCSNYKSSLGKPQFVVQRTSEQKVRRAAICGFQSKGYRAKKQVCYRDIQ